MGAEQSHLVTPDVRQNNVSFFINGKEYNVKPEFEPDIGPTTLLVDYIRDKAGLKGTKYMCREGGCGCCVVQVKSKDPNTGSDMVRSVNACLIPVFACDGMEISTIENLGNKKEGYHQLQKQIVKFSGTQCGFCTPGMIMHMHSLTQSKPKYTTQDVEDHFDGNICRCTGYRPILEAFTSTAIDASEELRRKCSFDIEDCKKCPCALPGKERKCGNGNSSKESTSSDDSNESFDTCCFAITPVYIQLQNGEQWIKPTTLEALYETLGKLSGQKYRLVAGNTGIGVFKHDGPYLSYVDINNIPELKQSTIDHSLGVVFGANISLTETIEILQKAVEIDGYGYAAGMVKHIKRVGNVAVRNAGTIAGNLMMKHAHREFPSDIFLLLETVGAKLKIGFSPSLSKEYSPLEFRELDMNGKVILSIKLPAYKGNEFFFRSYKITRRYQNAHAYVNGALLFHVSPNKGFSVLDKPSICFGGIKPEFVHATKTEMAFVGQSLNKDTLNKALAALDSEVVPDDIPPDASPEYRKQLTQGLLYKTILGILGDTVKPKYKSGATEIERSSYKSKQTYDTDQSKWPLYEPVAKVEAFPQTSGEAQYVNDIHPEHGELFAAFVLSTQGNASINFIDASEALMLPGVVTFVQAKDIPGVNDYSVFYPEPEEIFAKDKVRFAGQPLGLILAENMQAAFAAVKKVRVTYENIKTPILEISDNLAEAAKVGKKEELALEIIKSPTPASVKDITQTLKGEFRTSGQYHFYMESQTCICIPREDGMDVFSSTQFMDSVQAAIAAALGMPNNSINVSVKRLGGGFGGKISKAAHIAAACSVAAYVTNKPVRIVTDLETNMKMIGKRLPYLFKYEVGVDNAGVILSLKMQVLCNPGCTANEVCALFAMVSSQSCYRASGWELTPGKTLTNMPPNTYCRAPGSTQGIAIIETIMEHVAWAVKKDPLEVRIANFIQKGDPMIVAPGAKFEEDNPLPKMIEDLKNEAKYDERKRFVAMFNQTNRWKKRGMSLVPMRYGQAFIDMKFPTYVAIYHVDGTVSVSHGGIEMGQGINTKVAQVVAYTLKIPMDKIKVKAANNLISPNAGITGNACTSELVCHSAQKACELLLERMAPVKAELKDATWEKLIAACYAKEVHLAAQWQPKFGDVKTYDVWGLGLIEVEVDMLTGVYKIVRADVVEDAGKSLSPEVDIGQVEGAFIMGLGFWTTEKLAYDKATGELLTHNTWEYKVPFPRDIPEDFQVTMLRNAWNPFGVLGSKATGEPPLCLSVCILHAIRHAIFSARQDAGNTEWLQIDGPVTPEDIKLMSHTNKSQFDL